MIEEEFIKVKTDDDKCIYSLITSKHKNKNIIIWVHGLMSNRNAYMIRASSHKFVNKGYDVIRFNLYGNEDGARRLENCTLQDHANDINTIINKKCNKYKRIFVVGFSYGAPAILIANNSKISAVSLWDPSFDLTNVFNIKRRSIEKISRNKYTANRGRRMVIGKKMIDESKTYTKEECLQLSENANFPIQVINADESYYEKKESYSSAGDKRNNRYIIKGSNHGFSKKIWVDEAIKQTLKWFKKF